MSEIYEIRMVQPPIVPPYSFAKGGVHNAHSESLD